MKLHQKILLAGCPHQQMSARKDDWWKRSADQTCKQTPYALPKASADESENDGILSTCHHHHFETNKNKETDMCFRQFSAFCLRVLCYVYLLCYALRSYTVPMGTYQSRWTLHSILFIFIFHKTSLNDIPKPNRLANVPPLPWLCIFFYIFIL